MITTAPSNSYDRQLQGGDAAYEQAFGPPRPTTCRHLPGAAGHALRVAAAIYHQFAQRTRKLALERPSRLQQQHFFCAPCRLGRMLRAHTFHIAQPWLPLLTPTMPHAPHVLRTPHTLRSMPSSCYCRSLLNSATAQELLCRPSHSSVTMVVQWRGPLPRLLVRASAPWQARRTRVWRARGVVRARSSWHSCCDCWEERKFESTSGPWRLKLNGHTGFSRFLCR